MAVYLHCFRQTSETYEGQAFSYILLVKNVVEWTIYNIRYLWNISR